MPRELTFLRRFHQHSFIFLLVGIFASVFYGIVDSSLIRLIKHLLDSGFVEQDQAFLQSLPIYLIGYFIVRSTASFLSLQMMARSAIRSSSFFRKYLLDKVLNYPSSVFQKHPTGELVNRVVYTTQNLGQMSTENAGILIRETVTVLGLLVVMLMASIPFTVIYLVTLPFMFFILKKVGYTARKNNHSVNKTTENLATHLQQLIQSEKVVKSFNAQKYESKRFSELVDQSANFEMKQIVAISLGSAMIQLVAGFALTLIIYLSLSPYLPPITAGEFTSLITAILTLLRPIKSLTRIHADWQKIVTYTRQLEQIMDLPLEVDQGKIDSFNAIGNISFKNVSFQYSQKRKVPILSNINLEVKARSSIAIVGPSGGGKSTLVSLLSRFYECDSGSICIDGHNLQHISLKKLRSLISLVGQDVRLLDGDILSNIAYGSDHPDLERAQKAAILAHAHDFIKKLPQGYSQQIGESGNLLSGGQKQRLALARAFYKRSPVLILDEATSALDHECEDKINQALESLMKTTTTFIIAHKIKTILNADMIVVIDQGRIIECGTHDQLIINQGFYAQMYYKNFSQKHEDLHLIPQEKALRVD